MATKVLIVDDDPLIHRLYQRHLSGAGYTTLAACNGREAIDVALRENPQVIVMDIMMPVMDGLSALKILKQTEGTKDVPVIVITSNAQYQQSQAESQKAGAALFLTKPFSPSQLLNAIRGLIPPPSAAVS